MTDDYLEAFVRESEENVVDLNNALLALENDPDGGDAIDVVFRTAHTLKGNFAAMGFAHAAELAHALEDLLDGIREGRLDVTPAVMDRVFDGVDAIESAVSAIERTGESSLDASGTIADLRALSNGDAPSGTTGPARGGGTTASESTGAVSGNQPPGASDVEAVYRVRVKVEHGDMKGVDGMLVLEAAAGEYELLGTVPDRAEVEDGAYEEGFELLVGAPADADVRTFFEDISTVAAVTVEEETARRTAPGGEGGPDEREEGGSDAGNASVDAIRSVRVDVDQLDDLYSLVEQLVTSRIKLRRSVGASGDRAATSDLDDLDKITASLQDTVMDMRLIPLRKVVNTFPRLVRDVARAQDKEVDFAMTGTDVELDRTILDELGDPLMHVLRNAVDHGIEPPDEREAKGKPREGTVRLRASRERDHVNVVVEDDGAGLDVEAIRREAIERDVLPREEVEVMAEEAVYDLIFHPGFSTSEEVTDVSGRGVGMDVVHSTVDRLDGSVSVSSTPGEGTTVSLRLPITVAIVRVLFVEVGDRVFGLPIKDVDEITPVGEIRTVNGQSVVEHADDIYPVLDLQKRLTDGAPATNGDGMLLRIRASERPVALRCDGVDRQEEVVTKPLEGALRDVPGVSGTALVGDGQVVPIIDVVTL